MQVNLIQQKTPVDDIQQEEPNSQKTSPKGGVGVGPVPVTY